MRKQDIIKEISELKTEECIYNTIKHLNETEAKRTSIPIPELSEVEYECLIGIANGRSGDEINKAIKLHSTYGSLLPFVSKTFI